MGCGALGPSIPLGRAECEGASTVRKASNESFLRRKLPRRAEDASENHRSLIGNTKACISSRSSSFSSSCSQVSPFVEADCIDVKPCSTAANEPSSDTYEVQSVSSPTAWATACSDVCPTGNNRVVVVAGPPVSGGTSLLGSTEAVPQPATHEVAFCSQEPDTWEPPLPHTNSSPTTTVKSSSRTRSRPTPFALGGLVEPLVPLRNIPSPVELQVDALRPNLVGEDWLQGYECAASGTSVSSADRGLSRSRTPPSCGSGFCGSDEEIALRRGSRSSGSVTDISSCCSAVSDSANCATADSDMDPKLQAPTRRCVLRHNSGTGSIATAVSGLSTAPPEDERDACDAVTESLDFVSLPRSDPSSSGLDDKMIGSDVVSDPPDSAESWASGTNNPPESQGDVLDVELPFMLERPFAGLETIFEDEDSDNERPLADTLQSKKTVSTTTSFPVHQGRQTSSWRFACGQTGLVGDPASQIALSSPEPCSAELARTAPCTEASPASPYNAQIIC